MDINRNNYELIAVDFIDGQLSPSEVAEFMVFLEDNPDIASEIEELRDHTTKSIDQTESFDSSFLKKDLNTITIDERNFEEMCIAYHEGDLTEEAADRLKKCIATTPERDKVFLLAGKSRLTPDKSLVMPGKDELKQSKRPIIYFNKTSRYISLIAAGLAIFFIMRPTFKKNKLTDKVNILSVQDKQITNTNSVEPEIELIAVEESNKTNTEYFLPQEKKITTPFIKENIKIAAIDTSEQGQEDLIRISRIEPKLIEYPIHTAVLAQTLNTAPEEIVRNNPEIPILSEVKQKGNLFLAKAGDITVNDLINSGINGINKMAETDLKYETITDENGKVTEFALSSESFNIRRKARRN